MNNPLLRLIPAGTPLTSAAQSVKGRSPKVLGSSGLFLCCGILKNDPKSLEQLLPRSFPRHNRGWFVLTWIFNFILRAPFAATRRSCSSSVIPTFSREWRTSKHCPNREVVQSQSSNSCFSPATPGSCHKLYPSQSWHSHSKVPWNGIDFPHDF